MNRAASGPWPGRAAPVIAGAALLWLAGCTSYQPVPRYPAWGGGYSAAAPSPSYMPPPSYSSPPRYFQPPPDLQPAPSPSGGSWLTPRAEAAEPSPPLRPVSPPLRPVDPDPPALRFLPPVTFLSPPADATDCTGWWRICHAY